MPFYRNLAGRRIFSVMELALVLAVLAVVATIVGPRMSRGAISPKSGEQLLVGHLRALRGAIDAYTTDHNGRFPTGDVTQVTGQLTQFTDRSGGVSGNKTPRYCLGPYLREIPAMPVGMRMGAATLSLWPDGRNAGWVYDPITGRIWANTCLGERDASGREYATY